MYNPYANVLFIGSNDMNEINSYVKKYRNGLFIEAIPDVFKILEKNLHQANATYNTNYKAINRLVCDEIGKEHTFHIFNNNGASSSIYAPNPSAWQWPSVQEVNAIQLKSTTVAEVLKEHQWENVKYDLILDVQGAELDVLKGFGESNLRNIQNLTTEISTEQFYNGAVLFCDLHNFIVSHGFKLVANPTSNHCDVTYHRS